ncbi:hypothetical protein JAAARDRAFT_179811 [Jaapia argillacea MUCL 33604]|uniref:Reverse transcriptase domain-containing protein n=1 Tax=Jaapia argillacea MUCL 33604 TaxID=933084 RepID=A0A067Q153_9AGAM|nr:hypothetical protein JAAARDRAFT_179811 [Jaapia argillacea MUCL 33604]
MSNEISTALGQTLHFITSIKLKELERQRDTFTAYANKVLGEAEATSDPVTRVSVLIKGIQEWSGLADSISPTHNLDNIEKWLDQARSDPSIAEEQLRDWAGILSTQLRHSVTRFDYAKLFGNLLTEWLKSGDSQATASASVEAPEESSESATPSTPTVPQDVRAEKLEQKAKIQELIFEPKVMDTKAIEEYLESLFSGDEASAALKSVRKTLNDFGSSLRHEKVDSDDLDWLIKSLLSRDLLSAQKAATVKTFLGNTVVLEEVASVLNMQLASLESWEWPEEGVYVEMRRHLSGKYRAYMDTEIITALLFQYLGMKWSIAFKDAFRSVVKSRAWKRDTAFLTRDQLQRRSDYLPETAGPAIFSTSIEGHRQKQQSEHFFMTQLPGEYTNQSSYDQEPKPGEKANSGLHAQQIILRMVSTEAHLQRALHGRFTIMRADLEWFGPSLPHDSVLTVLRFFGLPPMWLTFLEKWLTASLHFDVDVPSRTRRRGVPIAHCLSVLCGEAVLFGMDFAVNQKTGLYLYRIYDDFWFWHHDPEKCATAWREMQQYANLVGITFNMKKTGGACVGGDLEPSLPKGVVGWGLLKFDANQGRFVIDQAGVDIHIKEIRRQLGATKSVFGFVNAYNKYIEFIKRQFGQSAQCFGKAHVDEIIQTLNRIQNELFPDTNGSIVKRLQGMIEARFGIKDIPFGWFFFPISYGGLEIHNPIIDYLTLRESLSDSPETMFPSEMENDKKTHISLKEAWETSATVPSNRLSWDVEVRDTNHKGGDFMSFEEYILGRETRLTTWGATYLRMQSLASATKIALPTRLDQDYGSSFSMTPYDAWVVALYAEELFKRFGTLIIVEPTLIPVGMVSVFRNSKISWDS